jgi:hypothetical protein
LGLMQFGLCADGVLFVLGVCQQHTHTAVAPMLVHSELLRSVGSGSPIARAY